MSSKWFHYNDSVVEEIREPLSTIISPKAYILLYRLKQIEGSDDLETNNHRLDCPGLWEKSCPQLTPCVLIRKNKKKKDEETKNLTKKVNLKSRARYKSSKLKPLEFFFYFLLSFLFRELVDFPVIPSVFPSLLCLFLPSLCPFQGYLSSFLWNLSWPPPLRALSLYNLSDSSNRKS